MRAAVNQRRLGSVVTKVSYGAQSDKGNRNQSLGALQVIDGLKRAGSRLTVALGWDYRLCTCRKMDCQMKAEESA